MGATVSALTSYATLVGQTVLATGRIVAETFALPLRLLQFVFNILSTLFNSLYAQAQNYRMIVPLVATVAFIFLVGPFGVSETSFFIEAINQFLSCGVRSAWEVFNKVVIYNTAAVWVFLADTLNKAFVFIGAQAGLAVGEVAMSIQCVADEINVQVLFDIPAQLWIVVGSLPFSLLSGPRQNKGEAFPTGTFGYHYPLENFDPPTMPRRFEFNPDYAAQGPAMPVGSSYPNAAYMLRDIWSQISRLWEDAGKLVFGLVSKLSRPAQRLFPAFYVSVHEEESVWRETSDLVCRATELPLVTFLWPFGSTAVGEQDARDDYTRYACRFLRAVGECLASISLALNDAFTTRRPIGAMPGACPPAPSVEELLVGVPVADFFVPGAEPNLLLFRSNINFCEFNAEMTMQTCQGLAFGAFSFRNTPILSVCPEWNGAGIPLADERINYLGRIVRCLFGLFEAFLQESDGSFAVTQQFDEIAELVTCWLNWIVDDLLYLANAIAFPVACELDTALQTWITTRFGGNVIKTIEYAYDDSCAAAVDPAEQEDNIFLCLIVILSRANPGSFWGALCDILDGIDWITGWEVMCEFRKRSLGDPAPPSKQRHLTYYQSFRLASAYYAYETRSALHAFDYCVVDANTTRLAPPYCDSRCATRPCVDAALDCVRERLEAAGDADNYWHGALANGTYTRAALRGAALAGDVVAGCADGEVGALLRTVNATAEVLRDMAARQAVSLAHYGTTHTACAEEAAGDSDVYLRCIRLEPLLDTWEDTLAANNITADSSMCGALLWSHGIKLDGAAMHADRRAQRSYEGCLTLLAYGAVARAEGTTHEPLANFLDGWSAAHSVSRSTEELRQRTRDFSAPRWAEPDPDGRAWLRQLVSAQQASGAGGPTPMLSVDKNGTTTGGAGAGAGELPPDVALFAHETASLAYAWFNYQADVYERVVRTHSSGTDKDELDNALFRSRVLSVTAAVTTRSPSFTQAQRELHQHLSRNKARAHHVGGAGAPDADDRDGGGIAEVARAYGHSLMWVDRLYMNADNVATGAAASGDGLSMVSRPTATSGASSSSSVFEFRVRQRYAGDVGGRGARCLSPLLGIRVADDLLSTETLADKQAHFARAGTLQRRPIDPFAELELARLTEALEHYTSHNLTLRHQRSAALHALRALDTQLARADSVGDMLAEHVGRSAAALGRAALRITANLVANRLRLGSLPAAQAAHVVVDLLTRGEHDDLRRWLANERGYIVGVGYVDRDVYDDYMRRESATRRRLLAGPFAPPTDDELDRLYLSTAARTFKRRVARKFGANAEPGTHYLPGDTAYGRMVARQRARLRRRLDFQHRSHFLVRHGLHDDEHLRHVATENWRHYEAALAANSTQQRRELSQLAASGAATNKFWIDVWDRIVAGLGGNSDAASDTLDSFVDIVLDLIEAVLLDLIQLINDIIDEIVTRGTCQGPTDYAAGGTGVYRIGCIPFVYERLFDWYSQYPQPVPASQPYGGIFGFFVYGGYAQWPDEMLAAGGDCVPKRDPNQCPAQAATFWSQPIGFFENLCITNACDDAPLAADRPACATFNCDYCPREWKSAAEFGFTSGWNNIATWSALWRAWVADAVLAEAASGFGFVIALFVFTEFPGIFPIIGPIGSYTFVVLSLFGDTFIDQTPERFTFTFFGIQLLMTTAPLIGWIAMVLYVVNLFPVVFLNATETLFGDVVVQLALYVSPDQILVWIFTAVGAVGPVFSAIAQPIYVTIVTPFFGQMFSDLFDIEAAAQNVISVVGVHLPDVPPTTAETIYSVFGAYLFAELLVFAGAYALFVLLLLVPVAVLVEYAVYVFGVLFRWYVAVRTVLLRMRVRQLGADLEDAADERAALRDAIATDRETEREELEYDDEVRERTGKELRELRRRTKKLEQAKNE